MPAEPSRGAAAALRSLVARALPQAIERRVAAAYRRGRAVTLRGTGRWCACCRRGYRRFLATGSGRPDALCPGCGSLERHRLFCLWLEASVHRVPAQPRVLHFAPEPAVLDCLSRVGATGAGYVSVDVEPGLAMRVEDITRLSFDDASFDIVLCSHVLEHVPDDAAGMREVNRVLAPGGWALMQVPIDRHRERTFEAPDVTAAADRLRLFGQDDHVRVYGGDYPDRLRAAGLRVTPDRFAGELDHNERERVAVDPFEVLWICQRGDQRPRT